MERSRKRGVLESDGVQLGAGEKMLKIDFSKLTQEKRGLILARLNQNQDSMRMEIARLEALKKEVMNAGVCRRQDWAGNLGGNAPFHMECVKQDDSEVCGVTWRGAHPVGREGSVLRTYLSHQDRLAPVGEAGEEFAAPVVYVQERCKVVAQSSGGSPWSSTQEGSSRKRGCREKGHCGNTEAGRAAGWDSREQQAENMSQTVAQQFIDVVAKHLSLSTNDEQAIGASTSSRNCWKRQLFVMRRLQDSFRQLDGNTQGLIKSALSVLAGESMPGQLPQISQTVCSNYLGHVGEFKNRLPTQCYAQVLPIQQKACALGRPTSITMTKYLDDYRESRDQPHQISLDMSSSGNAQEDRRDTARAFQPCLVRIV